MNGSKAGGSDDAQVGDCPKVRTMKKRYSIWGREYGSDHDVELIQVDSNPQPVVDGLMSKTLTVKNSIFDNAKKKTKIRKYTWLRIVENKA